MSSKTDMTEHLASSDANSLGICFDPRWKQNQLPIWSLQWPDPKVVAGDGKTVYSINSFPYKSDNIQERKLEWDTWRERCEHTK